MPIQKMFFLFFIFCRLIPAPLLFSMIASILQVSCARFFLNLRIFFTCRFPWRFFQKGKKCCQKIKLLKWYLAFCGSFSHIQASTSTQKHFSALHEWHKKKLSERMQNRLGLKDNKDKGHCLTLFAMGFCVNATLLYLHGLTKKIFF